MDGIAFIGGPLDGEVLTEDKTLAEWPPQEYYWLRKKRLQPGEKAVLHTYELDGEVLRYAKSERVMRPVESP